MESIKEIFSFLVAHSQELAAILLAVVSVMEMVTRLTPTEKDDGAVERIGAVIRKVLDFLRIPNIKK